MESKASARTANTNTKVSRIGSSDKLLFGSSRSCGSGKLAAAGGWQFGGSLLSRNGSHQRRPKQLQGLGWGTLTRGGATSRPAEESTGLAAMGKAPLCMTETNEPVFPDHEKTGCSRDVVPGVAQVQAKSRNYPGILSMPCVNELLILGMCVCGNESRESGRCARNGALRCASNSVFVLVARCCPREWNG